MAGKHLIYSSLASGQKYSEYSDTGSDVKEITAFVVIHGGAGCCNPVTKKTEQATVTEVDDEQLAMLERCHAFKKHVKDGFIIVSRHRVDTEKAASDLEPGDTSKQLQPGHFQKGNSLAEGVVVHEKAESGPRL